MAGSSVTAADLPLMSHFTIGTGGTGERELSGPQDVCVSSDGEIVYVADTNNHRIQVFTREGSWLRCIGGEGEGPGQFKKPVSLCLYDNDRLLFVCDHDNFRIQVLDANDGSYKSEYSIETTTYIGRCGPWLCRSSPQRLLYVIEIGGYWMKVLEIADDQIGTLSLTTRIESVYAYRKLGSPPGAAVAMRTDYSWNISQYQNPDYEVQLKQYGLCPEAFALSSDGNTIYLWNNYAQTSDLKPKLLDINTRTYELIESFRPPLSLVSRFQSRMEMSLCLSCDDRKIFACNQKKQKIWSITITGNREIKELTGNLGSPMGMCSSSSSHSSSPADLTQLLYVADATLNQIMVFLC